MFNEFVVERYSGVEASGVGRSFEYGIIGETRRAVYPSPDVCIPIESRTGEHWIVGVIKTLRDFNVAD